MVNFLIHSKGRGLRESTLVSYSRVLRHISRHANLDDLEAVKLFIANKRVMDSTREKIANIYDSYVEFMFYYGKSILNHCLISYVGIRMRFILYGAGAIGSIIGGHLHRTGHDVVLVGNSTHVDKIHEAGLRLVTPDETYVLTMRACKKAIELTPFKEDDVLLLTAKSQHTLVCLGQLKNAGAPRTLPIFCVQNSICNEAIATRVFDRIYGVMVRVPGIFLQPGEVINPIVGNAGFLEVGLYPRGSDELAHELSDSFRRAGFWGGVNEEVMRVKGAKCLRNLGNAMGAITDGKGDGSGFMAVARREAMEVWRAAGIEWEDPEQFDRRTRNRRWITKMPKGYEHIHNRGSSWQSLIRSTGNIEAEQLNGDVVKLGRLLGIETPYNEVLWRVAEEMALKGDKPGKYTAEDLLKMIKETHN